MRLLMAIPFLLLCGCVFNVNPPYSYDDQIVIADMALQRFAPEACAYNPRAIKYVCEDGQADVLNEDLIIIRQKLITYLGKHDDKEVGNLMIKELFKCRKTGNGDFFSCEAKLPQEILTEAGLEYRGEKDNLHLYAEK